MTQESLEGEIKQLIVDTLTLEHVAAADIDRDAPLFFQGLGLDSIDALELGMALEQRYGIRVGDDPDENAAHFASVRTLAEFVSAQRGGG
jgi:acyl carrier protein